MKILSNGKSSINLQEIKNKLNILLIEQVIKKIIKNTNNLIKNYENQKKVLIIIIICKMSKSELYLISSYNNK